MKTILLATSNKDKFKVVKYLLQKAGLEETEYQILSLKDVNYSAPDEKEQGSIDQRARTKAISVVNNIPNREIYDFIIGIDDGIELKGTMRENVKDHINKILFENYLEENESIIFPRAYCVVDNMGKTFEIIAKIEYKYKPKANLKVEPNSYPLSQVAAPLNSDKSLTEMDKNEANEYCWESCKDELIQLANFIKRE